MKYNEIRKNYQNGNYLFIIDRYSYSISPLITKHLIKTNLTPNMITVMMMLSGIIGAIFFAIPSIAMKIIGTVFIHLWYILDCCDGEVARIKKKYSKFGKEIDYTAHILNHPLFTVAFMLSMMQLKIYNSTFVGIIFMIIIIINLMFRNMLLFNSIYEEKMKSDIINDMGKQKVSIKKRLIDNLSTYPNFALIFPIIYLIDILLKTNISIIYAVLFAIISSLIIYLKLFNWIRKIIKL